MRAETRHTASRAPAPAAALARGLLVAGAVALGGCTLPPALQRLGASADGPAESAGAGPHGARPDRNADRRPDRSPVAQRDPGTAFHPGWQEGALMRLAPASLRTLGPQLPALHALGVRGLLLERVLQGHGPAGNTSAPADLRRIDPAVGTLDDFDTFVLQAHAAGLAVLLRMPAADADTGPGYEDQLRWWLNRTVDGLQLAADPEALPALLPRVLPVVAGYRNRVLLCTAAAAGCRSPAPLPAGLAAALGAAAGGGPEPQALAQALPLLLPGTPVLPERASWGALTPALLALRAALPPTEVTPLADQGGVSLWRQALGDQHLLVLVNPTARAAVATLDDVGALRRFSNEHPAGGAASQADAQGRLMLALAPYSLRVLQSLKTSGP